MPGMVWLDERARLSGSCEGCAIQTPPAALRCRSCWLANGLCGRRQAERRGRMNRENPMGGAALELGTPTGRLSGQTVEQLHQLLSGEVRMEGMIPRFLADRQGAAGLLYLPPQVAQEILKRPADFIRAAKQHGEPDLKS